jgi:hypothetical protein
MLNILRSSATEPAESFVQADRQGSENNMRWLERHRPQSSSGVDLLLVGGRDALAYRLRNAQAQVRHDLSPSNWSHVLLLEKPDGARLEATAVREISLQPAGGFGFPPPTNGVQRSTLGHYRSTRVWPNIAVLHLPCDAAQVWSALRDFEEQRAVLDATELIVIWLAFLWGAGRAGNPLLDARGIPSAAMVETVVGAASYELTPGLENRASCPEAIWQSAKWWGGFYAEHDAGPPTGAWCVTHRLGW